MIIGVTLVGVGVIIVIVLLYVGYSEGACRRILSSWLVTSALVPQIMSTLNGSSLSPFFVVMYPTSIAVEAVGANIRTGVGVGANTAEHQRSGGVAVEWRWSGR